MGKLFQTFFQQTQSFFNSDAALLHQVFNKPTVFATAFRQTHSYSTYQKLFQGFSTDNIFSIFSTDQLFDQHFSNRPKAAITVF
jgi:hypothetical protein